MHRTTIHCNTDMTPTELVAQVVPRWCVGVWIWLLRRRTRRYEEVLLRVDHPYLKNQLFQFLPPVIGRHNHLFLTKLRLYLFQVQCRCAFKGFST